MDRADVIILGAGAAGMFCAIEAARRGRRVILLDHARRPGDKIRISGGGRCNFTNLNIAPERFLSRNPRFALSALNRYTQHDFIARIEAAGIAWHEKTLGQLFCDGSAKEIIAMLMADMAEAGVDLRTGTAIGEIAHRDGFEVATQSGRLRAPALVVATGGKSIPKMGATGLGFRIARQFGLEVVETRPALVPLTFTDSQRAAMAELAGVSVTASAACNGAVFDDGLLFTHRGVSGPSVLQLSSYWREGDSLTLDLTPGADLAAQLRAQRSSAGRVTVVRALAAHMPQKLARQVAARARVTGRLADQPNRALQRVADAAQRWTITPAGSEGYRTAEVTLGGVDTHALDARTMAARTVPGLHFIGEVVDVTGWLGGYNFQWAWSSGWAAGQAV